MHIRKKRIELNWNWNKSPACINS